MPSPPDKTPLEVIYGGLAIALSAVTYLFGRRKQRREYLQLEPVAQIDFDEYKKQMETKFQEITKTHEISSSAILQSIQGVREDLAAMRAVKNESDRRLDRLELDSSKRWEHIEKRLDRALDAD